MGHFQLLPNFVPTVISPFVCNTLVISLWIACPFIPGLYTKRCYKVGESKGPLHVSKALISILDMHRDINGQISISKYDLPYGYGLRVSYELMLTKIWKFSLLRFD